MGNIKRVALVGLGAIGGVVAPKLYKLLGDEGFCIIADGERRERLLKGVTINGRLYHFSVLPAAEAGNVDLCIFAVKNTQLDAALRTAAPAIGKDTIILPLENGITSEKVLRSCFPEAHVLTSVIRVPSKHENGEITYPEGRENISFGEERNDTYTDEVTAVKELFDNAGIGYKIPVDMVRDQWLKFMSNVGENQVSAIIGNPYRGFQKSEHLMELIMMVSKEVIRVANKLGVNLSEADTQKQRDYMQHILPEGKTSTLQDIEAGRKTEVEYFAGTVVRLGKELGVDTPYNLFIYHAILGIEDRGLYMLD